VLLLLPEGPSRTCSSTRHDAIGLTLHSLKQPSINTPASRLATAKLFGVPRVIQRSDETKNSRQLHARTIFTAIMF